MKEGGGGREKGTRIKTVTQLTKIRGNSGISSFFFFFFFFCLSSPVVAVKVEV